MALRACEGPTRDARGGFCDATSRWGASREAPAHGGDGYTNGGIAVADFDGDGRLDLLVSVLGGPHPSLFLRRGDRYEERSAAWGLDAVSEALSAAAADFDGDGDVDLALGSERSAPVRLLRNEGGRFREVVDALPGAVSTVVIVPEDLDRDGQMDLLVGRYAEEGGGCEPLLFPDCPGGVDAWRQVAPWTFARVPVRAGARYVQAIRVMDLDRDGRDEVLVGADFGMLRGGNQVLDVVLAAEGVSLRERAVAGLSPALFAMGVAPIDADGDGVDEVLVTNYGRNALLSRRGDAWVDVAASLGADVYGFRLARPVELPAFDPSGRWMGPMSAFSRAYLDERSAATPSTKWTPVVFDYDDDGREDVFLPAGEVGFGFLPEVSDASGTMLRGTGAGFEDVTRALGLFERHDARAAVAADLDGDGDLDLALFHTASGRRGGGLRLLRNDASVGRSLTVIARGAGGARDGIGAVVTARVGGRIVRRRVEGNLSIYGTVPPRARFGLGDATVVDEVTVRFPSGAVRTRARVPAGEVVVSE